MRSVGIQPYVLAAKKDRYQRPTAQIESDVSAASRNAVLPSLGNARLGNVFVIALWLLAVKGQGNKNLLLLAKVRCGSALPGCVDQMPFRTERFHPDLLSPASKESSEHSVTRMLCADVKRADVSSHISF